MTETTNEKASQQADKRPCRHETNGSFKAFAEAFRAVAGREPEQWLDYVDCCLTLSNHNEEHLTEKQLLECDRIGRKLGAASAAELRTVALWPDETEAVIGGLVASQVDQWEDEHEGYGSVGTSRRAARAGARLNYFVDVLGPRFEEVTLHAWRKGIGRYVKACDCQLCNSERQWLYPDMDARVQEQLDSPPWQAVATEARRLFPRISPDVLDRFLKRQIRCEENPCAEAEAVRTVIEDHTHNDMARRLHLPISGGDEGEVGALDRAVGEVLGEWRGEQAGNRSGAVAIVERELSLEPSSAYLAAVDRCRPRR